MANYIKISKNDNVLVCLNDVVSGDTLDGVTINEDIMAGHKVAICNIAQGENVIKYDMPIGRAKCDIKKGDWVHTHNVATNLGDLEDGYKYEKRVNPKTPTKAKKEILAYKRKNGDIGIRNELWIVPTVGCMNGIAQQVKKRLVAEYDVSAADSVNVFPHNYGCSQMGDDHVNTRTILQNIVKHPNCGGVLVLGLGCENNQVSAFKETIGEYDEERVKFLVSQEVDDEIEESIAILRDLLNTMKADRREPVSIDKLKVGLECGGSDGFSGISANPLLGEFCDWLVYNGGTCLLTEVPEMFGAENILMQRAKDQKVFHDIVDMINGFKQYFKDHGQVVYENPSPGNKKGGITTLEEKSLGCVQKAGSYEVVDVLGYRDTIKQKGVNLMYAPGNDLVATTALGSAGCHIVLFTTGRGTPYGGFVPTMKISTNSDLAKKKPHWIDFDAGKITQGVSYDAMIDEFTDYVCDVCSGVEVNNELNDFREIAIFKSGVTL